MKNRLSANFWATKTQKMYYDIRVEQYHFLDIRLNAKPLIYIYGTLGMWKTTLSQILLSQCINEDSIFPSPTYTYYNSYKNNIYHFDLYRLQNYEEFIHIWWEEILLNRDWCIIVEWPELIEEMIEPDIRIYIEEWNHHDTRNLKIELTPQYLS